MSNQCTVGKNKKREEKLQRKRAHKAIKSRGKLEDIMPYLDFNGNIQS